MKSLIAASFLLLNLMIVVRAAPLDDTPLQTDDPKAVALYQAASKGDLDEVKNLVGSGAPIDGTVGSLKSTALMEAIGKGHLDVEKYLIDYHAKIDQPDAEGSTPLLHACFVDNADCAQALIDAGANVNLGSQYLRTPLMYAAQKGDDRIVQALIAHKVDINATCGQGPAVKWAALNDHLSTVKLLVGAGADPNLMPTTIDRGAYNTLGSAASVSDIPMEQYLIDQKAQVDGLGAEGRTPLMCAVIWGRSESVGFLLEKGANLEAKGTDGNTPLIIAANRGDEHGVHLLLEHKANPDATNAKGETALAIAGDRGDLEIVDLLKNAGAKNTEVHILAKEDSLVPLAPAQSWALAVGAIYSQRFGYNPRILGKPDLTRDNARKGLNRDWNITNKDNLLDVVDKLETSGMHQGYQDSGAKLAQLSQADFDKLVADHPEKEGEVKAMRASYIKWTDRSGLAWDLCRAANIVNEGFAAHYLTEKEAWLRLLDLARVTQSHFASWQEMSDNFLDGREVWQGKRDPRFDACSALMLDPKEKNSPWVMNPWKTDLSLN